MLYLKLLLPLIYAMPVCISVEYKKILDFSVIIRITTLKSYFSITNRCICEPETVPLFIPYFMQLSSKLLCTFRELLNGNCIMVYLCQLSALLRNIRGFLLS